MSLIAVWTTGRSDAAASARITGTLKSLGQQKSFDRAILLITGLAAIGATVWVYMLAVSLGIAGEDLATLTVYP